MFKLTSIDGMRRSLSYNGLSTDVMSGLVASCMGFIFLTWAHVRETDLGSLSSRNDGSLRLRWDIIYY